MNKQILALFIFVNFTLLKVRVTPSKLILLALVSIVVLKIYKKLWEHRPMDEFKAADFNHE